MFRINGLKQRVMPQILSASNAGIRIVLLLSKFGFIIFLAKYSTPEVVLEYGIIVVSVSVAVTLVGLDFYTYANREFMQDNSRIAGILSNQIALILSTYLVLVPVIGGLWLFGVHLVAICLIVTTEHLSQECIRLLIARRNPILATLSLAPKAALWVVALLGWKIYTGDLITLTDVVVFWVIGNLASLAVGAWFLRRELALVTFKNVDRNWIIRGMRIAAVFLVSGVIGRSFFLVDRVLMQGRTELDVASAYVLFASLFTSVYVVVEAAVFNFALPDLVEKHHQNDIRGLSGDAKWMLVKAVGIASCGILLLILFSGPILAFIGKSTYQNQMGILYSCAAISLVYVMYLSTHFILYAMRKDRMLLLTSAITFGVFVAGCLALAEQGPLTVPVTLAVSFLLGAVLRSIIICKRFSILGDGDPK